MAFVKNNGYRTPHYFNCSPDSLEFSNNKDKKLRNYKHSAVDLVDFPGITVTALIYIRGYMGLFCAILFSTKAVYLNLMNLISYLNSSLLKGFRLFSLQEVKFMGKTQKYS